MNQARARRLHALRLLSFLATLSGASIACSGNSVDGSAGSGAGGGSSPTGQADPCSLSTTLSGAVTLQTSAQSLVCVSAISTGPSFELNFLPDRTSPVSALAFAIAGAKRSEIAANLSTVVVVLRSDKSSFSALGCQSTLTENGFLRSETSGDRYHVAGTGSCTSPAVSSTAEQIQVSPFQFDSTVIWNP